MKGTDQVLRALAAARRSGARLRLLVIGDGDALDEYRRLAFQLGLAEEVEFLGSVPYGERLFSLWDRAHLTVVTNLTAEISRNVLLSMARATPLVMYENAGTDALLPQGVTTLVPRGDEQALSAVFLRAWREREPFAAQLALGRSFAATTTLEACHRRRAKLAAELVAKTRPLRVTPASR
jgi:glycosyltransferase involved in cell wall biosynthesis